MISRWVFIKKAIPKWKFNILHLKLLSNIKIIELMQIKPSYADNTCSLFRYYSLNQQLWLSSLKLLLTQRGVKPKMADEKCK